MSKHFFSFNQFKPKFVYKSLALFVYMVYHVSLCDFCRCAQHCVNSDREKGFVLSYWIHCSVKMDFQHRAGGKTGSGGVASASESNRDRRERLRQLALETIDINKDPYFMKNHLGSYECKLCLTLHNNEVWSENLNLLIYFIICRDFSIFISFLTSSLGELSGSHTGKEAPD